MPVRDEDELYDLYLDACMKGEAEDPGAFCERHGIGPELRPWVDALHEMVLRQRPAPAAGAAALAAEDGLPYERLGEFRLVRTLDRGGMGMIFLAEQESLGRVVALKVVRPELQDSPTAAERFRREALAAARLQHQNIVRLFAVGEENGVAFLAMELVPGKSLDVLLDETRKAGATLPAARVVRWMRDLSRALHYAHGEGVVHRDVKPGNIRITPDDRPLLLDFGIARDVQWEGATITQAFAGSPVYAAPEQLRGGAVDARADVYAVGATMYECLVGRAPLTGETVEQVVARVLHEEPASPRLLNPGLSRDLEVVVQKALAKDPDARYADAGALADDLDAVLEFRPIRARPPGVWDRVRKWARRRPGWAATLLTLALALVAVIGWSQVAPRLEARDVVAEARARIGHYRELRAETAELEDEVRALQDSIHAAYFTAEQDRLLDSKELEVEQMRRRREEDFHAVLDLLRRAERLDPGLEGIDALRAELFAEKRDEARNAKDRTAEAFFEDAVRRLDPGRLRATKRGRFPIVSDPPGAEVFLYRYRELRDVSDSHERRLVPVPHDGSVLPVAPGTWSLRVVTPAGDLAREDLIVSVAGHPIRDCVLALEDAHGVRRGDRLIEIGGRPVRDLFDVETLDGAWVFADAGAVTGPVRVGSPADAARLGGLGADVYTREAIRSLVLPAGLDVRATAAPTPLHGRCRVGTSTVSLELDEDDYLVVYRRPGKATVRQGFRAHLGQRQINVPFELVDAGPPGFVFVATPNTAWYCHIMEREVTAAEYLLFLNDRITRAVINAAAPTPVLYPRQPNKGYLGRDEDGAFFLTDEWRPDWPVIGVNLHDARAYATWLTAREKNGVFSVPTHEQWVFAAAGSMKRDFAFGSVFRPKWFKSCYARPRAVPEPVLRFPIDESPCGAFDMTGGAAEWTEGWYDEPRGLKRVCGGSWANGDPKACEIWGRGVEEGVTSGAFGFRLAWRPE